MDLGIQVFRLSEESFRHARSRNLVLSGVWLFLMLVILAFVGIPRDADPRVWLLVFVVVLVVSVIGNFSQRRRVEQVHRTVGLAIGPDVLRYVSALAPPVEMTRTEVVRLQEGRSGLLIEATAPRRAVFIPVSLERYALARDLLSAWRTPEPLTRRGPGGAAVLAGWAIGILGWLGGKCLENPWLAAVTTLAFLGVGVRFAWIVSREPRVPPKTKSLLLIFAAGALLVLLWRFIQPVLEPAR